MSDPREPAPGTRRAGWAALAFVIALAIPALLSLTSQASFAPLQPRPAVMPALTERLVFVVVDGLRYDFATNPSYAPSFARNMQRHSSAEVWASQVTMTSAAALAFGTGTRSTFTQVVLNVDARRTQANHVFDNARAAGLKSGIIGDPVWAQAYGELDYQHLSKPDLALDVDDSPELFAVAHDLLKSGRQPNLLVLHFFASDHLQHSFGVFSKRYREFFRRFDANLQRYLDALPRDTTVVVLSDHGALDNGNHGVDSELERKSPMFAYGPGVRPGQKLVLDQADIAPTLAALLGIASPAHGVGMPATELIEAEPERLAELSCGEAARIAEYGRLTAGETFAPESDGPGACGDPAATPDVRIRDARARAHAWDGALAESTARRGVRGFIASIALLALFGAWFGGRGAKRALAGAVAALSIAGAMVAITAQVDWTLPPWNDSRAALMWIATALLAIACLWPAASERVHARAPLLALCIAPGILYASFPTNTQLHAAIIAVVVWLSALVLAVRIRRPRRELATIAIAGLIGCGVALRVGTVRDDALAALSGGLGTAVGVVMIAVWLGVAAVLTAERCSFRELAGAFALSATCALPHAWIPAALGSSLLVGLPVAAFWLARRGHGLLGRALLMATYGLVSRPVELAAVLAAVVLAEVVGAMVARGDAARPGAALAIWPALSIATALFALGYVARLGVQGGLDFVTMDWSAGRFDSIEVRPARVALALVVKYGAALSLVGWALLGPLAARLRRAAVAIVSAGLVLRFGTLAAILFAPWVSFWSRYRMLGELGPTLIMSVLVAALAIALSRAARAPAHEFVASPSRS